MSNSELTLVKENQLVLHFKKGEIIRKQGVYLSHVITINAGLAKMHIEGSNNRDVILKIIKPSNFIGGPGMYIDQRHHYTVKALMNTSACFIDVKTFKDLLYKNVAFADEFFKDFSRNVISTYDSTSFDLVLSNGDLGDLTGMSADSASKCLRNLREDGIIDYSRKIMEIKDITDLKKVSALS